MSTSPLAQATITSPDLMGILRSRRTKAQIFAPPYAAATVSKDTMLFWLAQAAKELREAAGRKQVHIAAEINKDQSTIYRFEQGQGWPRETDLFVAGYAADLDISPMDIWAKGLQMWQEAGDSATVAELSARRRRVDLTLQEQERDAIQNAQPRARSASRNAKRKPA